MNSFEQILKKVNEEVEQLQWPSQPANLYEPITYTLQLGGKRLRPALTLMACELFTDDINNAMKPALGIELFHNFTLLHDDIMDKAALRRGMPTVYVKWSVNHAILSGDIMQIYAYMLLSQAPSAYLKQVLDVFSKTAKEVCEGQQHDIDFEGQQQVTPEEYIEMVRLKTAVLMGCALQIGAIIGGASNEDALRLYRFGEYLGIAFQLMDDMLDVYGNEQVFGKKIGGDILCNKHTYLLIQAKMKAKGATHTQLYDWLHHHEDQPELKISSITEIYNQLEVKKICEEVMFDFYKRAIAELDLVTVSPEKKHELAHLAQKLLFRND